jgi:hypothetical protein
MRHLKTLVLMLLVCAASARAEHKYRLGTMLDLAGGVGKMSGDSRYGIYQLKGYVPFYSASPSLKLTAEGQRSKLDVEYAFLWERYQGSNPLGVSSHVLATTFNSRIGRRLNLELRDSFYNTPDFPSFSAAHGSFVTPEGFQYVYDPLLTKRDFQSNDAHGNLDIDLSKTSSLTVGFGSSVRHYDNYVTSNLDPQLNSQIRTEGSIGYSLKGEHHAWNIRYAAIENRFDFYPTSYTQTATIGWSFDPSRSVRITFEAGPSYLRVPETGRSDTGYVASASISRTVRSNRISLYYARMAGDSSGYGWVSDIHYASFMIVQSLGRRVTFNFGASAFQGSERRTVAPNLRGVNGSAALLFLLHRGVVAIAGATLRATEAGPLSVEYTRFYIAIRFEVPELWRWSR